MRACVLGLAINGASSIYRRIPGAARYNRCAISTTEHARLSTPAGRRAMPAKRLPALPEWQDPAYFARQGFASFGGALRAAHTPRSEADLAPESPIRMRLAYDELLANQLALTLIRENTRRQAGRALRGDGHLRKKAEAALPFTLTASQSAAIAEITADMAAPARMVRLLQGDVGSGKTVVAMAALLDAVEAGCQGAFMAPTEILARQHMAALEPMAKAAGVRLRSSRDGTRARARGNAGGTRSGRDRYSGRPRMRFSPKMSRSAILDLLSSTSSTALGSPAHCSFRARANALRRTGDDGDAYSADIAAHGLRRHGCIAPERQAAGKTPVETRLLPSHRLDEVIAGLKRALCKGARAYWVCPLIEESEKTDLAAAEERAAVLRAELGPKVGLLHGRMKGAERDERHGPIQTWRDFAAGRDHRDRGWGRRARSVHHGRRTRRAIRARANSTQLRGRVGAEPRAPPACSFIRSRSARLRNNVWRRLEPPTTVSSLRRRICGCGAPASFSEPSQSGMPDFHFADLTVHGELLAAARDDAD